MLSLAFFLVLYAWNVISLNVTYHVPTSFQWHTYWQAAAAMDSTQVKEGGDSSDSDVLDNWTIIDTEEADEAIICEYIFSSAISTVTVWSCPTIND